MIISATSTIARKSAIVQLIQARTLVYMRFLSCRFLSRTSRLDNFDSILPSLQPVKQYLGIQPIVLKQITGSVDRSDDFDRNFRPLKHHLHQRWINIYLLAKFGKLPPIRVYQVGEQYYVGDGHHRVSVARALDMPFILGEVWRCQLKPA